MEDGTRVLGRVIDVLDPDVMIRQMIEQSEEDIKHGKIYTTDEIIEEIR